MEISEVEKIIRGSRNYKRAEARIRARLRREERSRARNAGLSVNKFRAGRFAEMAERSFDQLRDRILDTGSGGYRR